MLKTIVPPSHWDLLDRPIVITLVTLNPDGTPQASPVWFSHDGETVWVNTDRGRQKDRNMRARPAVALLFIDPENPYRYLELRCNVAAITEEGAVEHIHLLSQRYFGREDFYGGDEARRAREQRVIFRLAVDHAVAH
jgi:PPOX class probable F420-dependent enzyme